MVWLVSVNVGIDDISISLCMVIANGSMNILYSTKTNQNWLPLLIGLIPWIIIYAHSDLLESAKMYGIFNIPILNMLLQSQRIGPWKDYYFGERAHFVLTFISKTWIGWMIFDAFNRYNKEQHDDSYFSLIYSIIYSFLSSLQFS